MRTGIIGAGRLGTVLGVHLAAHGLPIDAWYSRTHTSAVRSAELVDAVVVDTAAHLVEHCDRVIIATPDDQIAGVAAELASLRRPPHTVVHLSGALGVSELSPLPDLGVACMILHPLQSIPDPLTAPERLSRCTFTWQGDEDAELLGVLCTAGSPVVHLAEGSRPAYHAAACMVSGHVVALVDQAIQLLTSTGFTPEGAHAALQPLLEGTVASLRHGGPVKSLTGPIARGDVGTVARHLTALRESSALETYCVLGCAAVDTAERGGTEPTALADIRSMLSSPDSILAEEHPS